MVPDPVLEPANHRAQIAHQCRQYLVAVIGAPVAETATGFWPYLDAERDAPHIVTFLLHMHQTALPGTTLDLDLVTFNRLPSVAVDAHENRMRLVEAPSGAHGAKETLYLYNWTTPCGQGYHFDALLPAHRASAQGRGECVSARPRESMRPPAGKSLHHPIPIPQSGGARSGKMGCWPCKTSVGRRSVSKDQPFTNLAHSYFLQPLCPSSHFCPCRMQCWPP